MAARSSNLHGAKRGAERVYFERKDDSRVLENGSFQNFRKTSALQKLGQKDIQIELSQRENWVNSVCRTEA